MSALNQNKIIKIALVSVCLILIIVISGCQPDRLEVGLDEEEIIEAEGILVGQIDNHSVEIEIGGLPMVFRINEGLQLSGINDGDKVNITYSMPVEIQGDEPLDSRPVLLSIAAIELSGEIREAEGIYRGQIDSHSVEIEINGRAEAFALSEGLRVDDIESGLQVSITYRKDGERQLLLSIDTITGPIGGGIEPLTGEGTLTGLIDAQSVEIKINRAFALGQGVSVEGIEDGSLVVFTFEESGPRPVIESIRAVEQPVEGEVMHGTLVGLIDSQSIEIEYFQAFALGSGVSLEGIEDGSEIVFTYRSGDHRPVLISVRAK